MTHEYTILTGGVILREGDAPACTAIAWAADTVLALGSDSEVLAISRGDSMVVPLGRRIVVAAAEGGVLEVGALADLAVLPAGAPAGSAIEALFRRGRLVAGGLPGLVEHVHGEGRDHHHQS